MYDFFSGRIHDLTPTTATIECAGIGFLCNISLNTYSALQGKEEGKLYVYESIREDAWVLFGFATKIERELFLLLIGVSGVGGNTARTMLGAYSASELANIIMEGNEKLLKSIKGLGTKTAQRIIVELKDKVTGLAGAAPSGSTGADASVSAMNQEVMNEAIEALKMLGFPPAPVTKVVRSILKDEPTAPVERVIKLGLKML